MESLSLDNQDNFSKYKDVESVLIGDFGTESKEPPEFSIFIPTFKRPDLLSNSFAMAYAQTYQKPYEIVICDNYDDLEERASFEVVRKICEANPRTNVFVRYYKNKTNVGQIGNWNRGIELAKGKYLLMCHDDDWVDKNILESGLKFLGEGKAVAFKIRTNDFRQKSTAKQRLRRLIVFGGTVFAKLFYSRKTKPLTAYDIFIRYMNPGNCGVIFETEKLKTLGGYDDSVFPFTDLYCFARYALKYGILYVKKARAHYRIAANESLKAAKTFPALRYRFMLAMIPFVKEREEKELLDIASAVYQEYIFDASTFWGIPQEEFTSNDLQRNILPEAQAKKINRSINIQAAKRYL